MTENEKSDLDKLHKECDDIRKTAFYSFKRSLQMSDSELKHTGFRTKEQCIIATIRHAMQKITTLENEFFAKYPDK